MQNLIPNEGKAVRPRDPPWLTKDIKCCWKNITGFTKYINLMVSKTKTKFPLIPANLNLVILSLARKKSFETGGPNNGLKDVLENFEYVLE